MVFVLSKIVGGLLQPSTLFLVALLVGGCLLWSRWWRTGRVLVLATGLGFLSVAFVPLDYWALAPLENRFPHPAQMPDHVDGIIVLGGAVDPEQTTRYGIPSLNEAAEVMTSAVKLARLNPSARLVFSGGSGLLAGSPISEAEVAKMVFADLGLEPDRVIVEDKSRNTYENALLSRDIVKPQPGETWLLVTRAAHTPRSMGIFRKVEWPVTAWPVAYKARKEIEPVSNLRRLDFAVHEWIGLLAYRILGRTNALFPAP